MPIFHSKHYVVLAEFMREVLVQGDNEGWILNKLENLLEKDNPAFDREKFDRYAYSLEKGES